MTPTCVESTSWRTSVREHILQAHFLSQHLHSLCIIRGANLSPFGEIRRFHLEIGHSRESFRSVRSSSFLWVICVMPPVAFFSTVGKGMDLPYSASDWLTLKFCPSSNQTHSWSLTFRRCRQLCPYFGWNAFVSAVNYGVPVWMAITAWGCFNFFFFFVRLQLR